MKIQLTNNDFDNHIVYVNFKLSYEYVSSAGKLWDKPRLMTYCTVEIPDYPVKVRVHHGESFCAPMDKFSRARGRTISLSRALAQFKLLNHDDRKGIFDALRAKGVKIG